MSGILAPSPRFIEAITGSHEVYQYVDVIAPSGDTLTLHITQGSVNVDRSAQYKRSSTMTAIDPTGSIVPQDAAGILTPFGTEVRPYKGVKYADGTFEVMPLGVFRLSKSTVSEDASDNSTYRGISVAMEMFDRSRTVARNKFASTYSIAKGTNIVTAIKSIVNLTFPEIKVDAVDTQLSLPAPQVYSAGDDPWTAILNLADLVACDVFFNVLGDISIVPWPDVSLQGITPDWSYVEGAGCAMTDLSTIYTDDPGYNGVILTCATVAHANTPIQAQAWDMEPSSPTYRYGPYGQVPNFVSNTAITTQADANAYANALLNSYLGQATSLQVTGWANPALEVGNLIQVKRTPLHVNGLYTVDSFNIPFVPTDAQNVIVRQNRTTT